MRRSTKQRRRRMERRGLSIGEEKIEGVVDVEVGLDERVL